MYQLVLRAVLGFWAVWTGILGATFPATPSAKDLADGTKAVGLLNTGTNGTMKVTVKWSHLKISGPKAVRDLWRQKDLANSSSEFSMPVAPHSAELVKIGK